MDYIIKICEYLHICIVMQDDFEQCTVETCYNEDLGTMQITLVYQVSGYIRVKT